VGKFLENIKRAGGKFSGKSINLQGGNQALFLLHRIIQRLVTFIKKVYFISHTATAYQMDKNVSFFS